MYVCIQLHITAGGFSGLEPKPFIIIPSALTSYTYLCIMQNKQDFDTYALL